MIPDFSIVPIQAADRAWLRQFWSEHWGGPEMVSRGKVHHVEDLPGFVALGSCAGGLLRPAPTGNESAAQPGARVCGVATYCIENEQCELLSIDSLAEGQGIGSALLDAVRQAAESASCRRLWLITTNDNLPALRFYQRRGLRLAAVHAGAVDQSRRIKPSIPEIGLDGIPLRDEIEMEFLLPVSGDASHRQTQVKLLPSPFGGGAGGEGGGQGAAGTRLSRRAIYESRWVNLYLDHMRTPSGKEIQDYHVIDFSTQAVGVYVTNDQGQVLMGRYYRYTINQVRWEVPAGGIEEGEDLLDAARREVFEETGYTVHSLQHYYTYHPAAGSTNKVFHLVRGKAGDRTGTHDPHEVEQIAWFTLDQLRQMIRGGEIQDGYTLTALLIAWEMDRHKPSTNTPETAQNE